MHQKGAAWTNGIIQQNFSQMSVSGLFIPHWWHLALTASFGNVLARQWDIVCSHMRLRRRQSDGAERKTRHSVLVYMQGHLAVLKKCAYCLFKDFD